VTLLAREDVEVHSHDLQTMTEIQAVCLGALSSSKTASLFWNYIWIMGCTWLPNLSKYSIAVIRPWRLAMGTTEYHDIAAQTFR
jgi:hypothetical protein